MLFLLANELTIFWESRLSSVVIVHRQLPLLMFHNFNTDILYPQP